MLNEEGKKICNAGKENGASGKLQSVEHVLFPFDETIISGLEG
jgi:hypothetical protein